VAFPLAPVGFAQAGGHRLALVLDGDNQPGFFPRIARGAMQYANGSVRTLGNDHSGARLDFDGLPRLVQLKAECFPITRSCEIDDNRFYEEEAKRYPLQKAQAD